MSEHLKRLVDETRRLYAAEQLQLSNLMMDERKLARPTFKFLQDIVKELMSRTRILRDVFGPADFEGSTKRPRNSQANGINLDRHAQAVFVQKLIDFVAKNKHPIQGCVASKIASGLDPVKMNELLQSLARVALVKVNETTRQRTTTATIASRPSRQQPEKSIMTARKLSSGRSRLNSKESPSSRKNSTKDLQVANQRINNDQDVKLDSNETPQSRNRQPDDESTVKTPSVELKIQEKDKRGEIDLEMFRMNLKKLRPKLEDLSKIDRHVIEKLQISLDRCSV